VLNFVGAREAGGEFELPGTASMAMSRCFAPKAHIQKEEDLDTILDAPMIRARSSV
jgi:hypothetical protein